MPTTYCPSVPVVESGTAAGAAVLARCPGESAEIGGVAADELLKHLALIPDPRDRRGIGTAWPRCWRCAWRRCSAERRR